MSRAEHISPGGLVTYNPGTLMFQTLARLTVGTHVVAALVLSGCTFRTTNLLAVLKSEIGDLNNVVRIVKALGMVNAPPDIPSIPR
jgi:hypothetical protein